MGTPVLKLTALAPQDRMLKTQPEVRAISDTNGEPAIRGFLHLPATPFGESLVLTHGAGANCQSPLLVGLAKAFCDTGMTVLRCDLPFRQARPHGPPMHGSAERDQQGLRRAIEIVRRMAGGRVFLGGHSYGGRQGTMLAASEPALVDGLLLLSYPLHPPKNREQLRTAHFPNLQTPALFVSGTRDGFGTVEELTAALKLIPARTQLLAVDGAGHELMSKRNADELPRMITAKFEGMFGSPATATKAGPSLRSG
jgi:predicted alpha/beta-hydrolase family hydrolase